MISARMSCINSFSKRVEEEAASLLAVDGKAKEAIMGRRDGPKFVIKSALGENNGGARRTIAVSRAWRRSTRWLKILAGQSTAKEKAQPLTDSGRISTRLRKLGGHTAAEEKFLRL